MTVGKNAIEDTIQLLGITQRLNLLQKEANAALITAAYKGDIKAIKLLLEKGAVVKAQDENGRDVDSRMRRMLLKAVAQVLQNPVQEWRNPALMHSIATLYREPNINVYCLDKIFTDAEQGDSLIIAQHLLKELAERIKGPRSTENKPYNGCSSLIATIKSNHH